MPRPYSLLNLLLLLVATGCGTTSLNLKPATDTPQDFSNYKSLSIQTSTAQNVVVPEAAQNRIKTLLRTQLIECCKDRFENISLGDPSSKDLLLHLRFTIYEEGNRFARAMLAGLGSMQIHADVELKNAEQIISGGEAGKTFAWGGVYGAVTGIDDLERDFVKEVVLGVRQALGIPDASEK